MTPEVMHALSDRLRQLLGHPVENLVGAVLGGGACQENIKLTFQTQGVQHAVVMRTDADTSLPGSLSRWSEYHVIKLAHEAGVATPHAQWLMPNLIRPNTASYFMPWLDGETIGARIVRAPGLSRARHRLPKQLCRQLALIHRMTAENSQLEDGVLDAPQSATARGLNWIRQMLNQLRHPRPASEWILRWLNENCPPDRPNTLVHGDFRVGNLMVQPDGLVAILDWEFAHWGDPYEDLAWFCVRDWRFGRIKLAAGGLTRCCDWWHHYEMATGEVIDAHRFHFWEVFGNLRWALSAALQGQRFESGGDFELLGIPRRAIEMEFEAIRLIERGPRGRPQL
ncbi:MAG: phosphotransferase family protein [Myxococcota bacterium]|nr:phosphotransferase family protein [Myxococcota bacterium]